MLSLKKFYKETPQAIADKGNWKCPSCRKICCCAACRRRKQKDVGDEMEERSRHSSGRKAKYHYDDYDQENSQSGHYQSNRMGNGNCKQYCFHHSFIVLIWH